MKEEKWRKLFLEKEEDAIELFPDEEDEAIELFSGEEANTIEAAVTEEPEEIPEPEEAEASADNPAAGEEPNNLSGESEKPEGLMEIEAAERPAESGKRDEAAEESEEEAVPKAEEADAEESDALEEEESKKPAKRRSWIKELASWVMILVISFAVAFFVNEVILINARIVSGSMEKTIMTGDRVMGTRFAYWFSEPERQDIVIFYSPDKSTKTLIKRIIGLPGDWIEIYDGVVYVNDEPLEEPYLWEEMEGSYGPYQVPQGCYFVLGDNRNGSGDSRYWSNPYIKRDEILGKACFIYWPRIKGLKHTE